MKARALVDIPSAGIKSGEFFIASETAVAALVAAGDADDKAKEVDVYGDNIPEPKRHPSADEPEGVKQRPLSGKKAF